MTGSGEFTVTTRAVVQARSGGRCETCGSAEPVHLHHRLPRRSGGSKAGSVASSCSNALHLCAPCHHRIETSRADALMLGQLLHAGTDPASAPVFLQCWLGEMWVTLHPDGMYVPITDNPEG